MPKPVVYLFTRDDCLRCRCGLARNLLDELKNKNRCTGEEFNLSQLPKDCDAAKYARGRGFRHFPTFLICHPAHKDALEKIWGDDGDKWNNNKIRQEVDAALDRVWRMR